MPARLKDCIDTDLHSTGLQAAFGEQCHLAETLDGLIKRCIPMYWGETCARG